MLFFQPIDNKRDQFRKYIETYGVVDMISKVLVKLFELPVKPEQPVNFILENLGVSTKSNIQIELLQEEVENLKQQVENLKQQLADEREKNGQPIEITPITIPADPIASDEVKVETDNVADVLAADADNVEVVAVLSRVAAEHTAEEKNVEKDAIVVAEGEEEDKSQKTETKVQATEEEVVVAPAEEKVEEPKKVEEAAAVETTSEQKTDEPEVVATNEKPAAAAEAASAK